MRHTRKTMVYTVILVVLALNLATNQAKAAVTGTNQEITFKTDGRLCFQNDLTRRVTMQISSGVLNSSQNRIRLSSGGGSFWFVALDNTQLTITYSVDDVKVSGDQNNDLRPIGNGETIIVSAGNQVFILWDITVEPLWPIGFALGMVGLGAMVGGPMLAAKDIKRRKYRQALVTGVTLVAIGIGLFLGWLW